MSLAGDAIPEDVLAKIYNLLSARDLGRLQCVAQRFKQTALAIMSISQGAGAGAQPRGMRAHCGRMDGLRQTAVCSVWRHCSAVWSTF